MGKNAIQTFRSSLNTVWRINMHYPPKHHQATDFTAIIETIKQFPLATLISVKNNEVFTTHIPLMYEASLGEYGALIGHIDKFNPQAELLQENQLVQVIFHGPNSYISPKIFSSTQLPTWNYVKVHISARATQIVNPEEIIDSIAHMTSFLETSETPYVLDSKSQKVQTLVDYIIGFRLEITAWEGKFKLSQDKLLKDRELAKEALIKESRKDITAFMDSILDN